MRNPPKKVLVLGSGALQIGQAGEFDYSGSQALKALKEEGIPSVLINPNIATIQTDEGLADVVYFLPVTPHFVEKILEKERCDAIFLSFGGQTALNCGLELERTGVFRRLGVRVLGTPVSTIRDTEDRHLFVERLKEIQVVCARSKAVNQVEEAVKAARAIGYPVMIRSGFSLGGKGSSIVYNDDEVRALAETALTTVPQLLVEECLSGWKEIEYEVVRDGADNCITVCNMENFDPMGVHTGESIVVAPSQTLDDYEYQMLRNIAIKTIRHLGIVGECNIQYALNPKNREYRVIEVNARLSRSSALASKATGYPLAYVAAKIALGYRLYEIPNQMTKVTTAFFEPSLDYIVCKFPRWDLEKFEGADTRIGSEMKSVGEVMSIGRSFAEVIQKAIRMTEVGATGLDSERYQFADLQKELKNPTPRRIFAIALAFHQGMSVQHVQELTGIDPFFLYEIERIVALEKSITGQNLEQVGQEKMRELKRAGFSDKALAKVLKTEEKIVRLARKNMGVRAKLSQIDTLAAEYPAETNFLYFTYAAEQHDLKKPENKSVLVLGSGCYRIGSSVEFDWCAVSAVQQLKKLGYDVILVNCNPETVSTDFDVCEKLIFDEISMETVLEIVDFANPYGVIVSMGGQTPNNLAIQLDKAGVKILGTSAQSIDTAEDRSKFSDLLDRLGVDQPRWVAATQLQDLPSTVARLGGYPVLVRPSYVLSGAAMKVAHNFEDLKSYLQAASDISSDHPVVMTKFEMNAREIEFDAVAKDGEIYLSAISEHIENAGVHSGDATLVIPPQRLTLDIIKQTYEVGRRLARSLKITGPFNIQLLSKEHDVKVIECNLRASRSFPFISKAMNVNFIAQATKLMMDEMNDIARAPNLIDLPYVCVKAPQFSFSRIRGTDPRLGVEMHSTGEVACFGHTTEEALLKSVIATGFKIPKNGVYIDFQAEDFDFEWTRELKIVIGLGLKLYLSPETARHFKDTSLEFDVIQEAKAVEYLKGGMIDLVIGIPSTKGSKTMRRLAVDHGISLITEPWLARRILQSLKMYRIDDLTLQPWSYYRSSRQVASPSSVYSHEILGR